MRRSLRPRITMADRAPGLWDRDITDLRAPAPNLWAPAITDHPMLRPTSRDRAADTDRIADAGLISQRRYQNPEQQG